MNTNLIKITFCIFSVILFAETVHSQEKHYLPLPELKQGYATLSGKITGNIPDSLKTESINLFVSHQLFYKNYEISINKEQGFTIQIPVFCVSAGMIESPYYTGRIYLTPNDTTKLEIIYNKDGNKKVNIRNSLDFTVEDLEKSSMVLNDILNSKYNIEGADDYKLTPDQYFTYSVKRLNNYLDDLKSRNFTPKLTEVMSIELKPLICSFSSLEYEKTMYLWYMDKNKIDADLDSFKLQIPKPGVSFYQAVFKYFNFDDPYYLYSADLPSFIQELMKNSNINLPPIEELSAVTWLEKVRNILGDSIGNNGGQFYNLLVAGAYIYQLEKNNKLLSEKQNQNITDFFKDNVLQSMISMKNKIMKELQIEQSMRSGIYETPFANKEKIIDEIVSKHKDKIVLIDLWATWCGPCIQAMKEMDPLKKEIFYMDNPGNQNKLQGLF